MGLSALYDGTALARQQYLGARRARVDSGSRKSHDVAARCLADRDGQRDAHVCIGDVAETVLEGLAVDVAANAGEKSVSDRRETRPSWLAGSCGQPAVASADQRHERREISPR